MQIHIPDKKSICALIVTFHPDNDFSARLSKIATQVSKVIIVDNGSASEAVQRLRNVQEKYSVELIINQDNLGIGAALNQGMRLAEEMQFQWVALFDQDSDIDDDLIEKLRETFNLTPDNKSAAMIGAEFRDIRKKPGNSATDLPAQPGRTVERIITSGSLLPLDKYRAIGPFREDLFIYYVDNEYCARSRKLGYRILKTTQPLMTHTYGSPTKHNFFGKTVWTKNYKEDTCYYIARNYTIFLKEYVYPDSPLWIAKSFLRCLKLSKPIAIFEENRYAKIRAIFQGWRDGIAGKGGKRPTVHNP